MALETRALADFMPLLLPNAPDAPWPVAEQCLRLAAAEFCERTRCWRQVTRRRITRATSCLVAPEYATIHEIENASIDGMDLTPTQFSDIDWQASESEQAGQPKYITQTSADTITLMPFAEGELFISVFLKPRVGLDGVIPSDYDEDTEDRANVVPDFLFVKHAETIAFGALNRLLNIPGQPYTNPARAAEYALMFERAVNTHFASNLRGQHRAAARVRPDHF